MRASRTGYCFHVRWMGAGALFLNNFLLVYVEPLPEPLQQAEPSGEENL
jgi:hypothetical protein